MLYGMLRWRPQGVIRRGRIASYCDADLACGHPGALYSSHISAVASLRTAAQTWAWCPASHPHSQCVCQNGARKVSSAAVASLRTAAQIWRKDILMPCAASTSAVGLPYVIQTWRPKRIVCRGRLAAHCGTALAYGHPSALRSMHIRSRFARRYPNMAPQTDRPPRSPRCALRHRPGVRTSWCSSQHRHPRWVRHTVCKNGARKGSSAAVASLRTAAQTWCTDIRVPCAASTSAVGLPYGMPRWRPRGIIRRGRLASHCDADLTYGHPGALHNI